MAIRNLSALDSLLQNKMQKMEQHNALKSLLSGQKQRGNPGYSLSQSLNAGDFMQQGPLDMVMRALGKTNVNLPSFGQPADRPPVESIQQQQPTQLPMMQAQAQPQEQMQQSNQKPLVSPDFMEAPADRKERLLREKEERALKSKRQIQVDKETFPFYKKIKEQAATTPEVDARLDEMDALLDTGRVQGPTLLAFLDTLKDLPWFLGKFGKVVEAGLLNEETQIFHKLSQDFLRDAKPYFGSNLSTREVELFLERVPSLMQSEGGRRGVIRTMRSLNDYAKAVDKALEDVIAENGGERPRHIESKVSARLKPAADVLRKSFKDSVKLIHKPSTNFIKQSHEKAQKKLA